LAGKSPKKRLVGQGSGLKGRSDRVTRLKMLPQDQGHHLECLTFHTLTRMFDISHLDTFMTRAGSDTTVDAGLDCSRLQQVALLQSTKLHCSTLEQSKLHCSTLYTPPILLYTFLYTPPILSDASLLHKASSIARPCKRPCMQTAVHANCSTVNAPSSESRRHIVSLQMKSRLFANEASSLYK